MKAYRLVEVGEFGYEHTTRKPDIDALQQLAEDIGELAFMLGSEINPGGVLGKHQSAILAIAKRWRKEP